MSITVRLIQAVADRIADAGCLHQAQSICMRAVNLRPGPGRRHHEQLRNAATPQKERPNKHLSAITALARSSVKGILLRGYRVDFALRSAEREAGWWAGRTLHHHLFLLQYKVLEETCVQIVRQHRKTIG